eukprot:10980147-Alexandrium_andersonii.AAC.1
MMLTKLLVLLVAVREMAPVMRMQMPMVGAMLQLMVRYAYDSGGDSDGYDDGDGEIHGDGPMKMVAMAMVALIGGRD